VGKRPLIERLAREVLADGSVWKRVDIIGDVAVLKVPPGVSDLEGLRRLGEALLGELKYVRSVWGVASPTEGAYRLRRLVHLAGEERTETVYVEHGCRFKVDVARVFVTPRLNYEHARVASLVRPGEVVVNMFAGAGLFSIIIACKSKPSKVYSIDINPHAYRYMVENVVINKVEGVVEPLLGDAAEIVKSRLRGVADRVLMPLPELALKYMYYAILALRSRGIIHVYLHVKAPGGRREALELAAHAAREEALRSGAREATVIGARKVRSVGPRTLQVVVDLEVEKH